MAERRTRATAARTRKPATVLATHDVQSAVEGVPVTGQVTSADGKIEFMGSWFKVADSVGLMPLLEFAHASSKGLDSTDMEGLVALYAMIRDCIMDRADCDCGCQDEWNRFRRHATDTKAQADDLMDLVKKCIELISARPTSQPGGSSAGLRSTSPNSKGHSSTGATARPELLEGMTSVADLDRST